MSERVLTPPLTLLKSALAHHEQGRLDEAESLYRQVLESDPFQNDALRLLGIICRQRGNLHAAREWLDLALEAHPGIPETYHDLGLVWFELRDYAKAIGCYQKAIELRFGFAEAHNNLGNAYYALGDAGNARSSYQAAIAHQPHLAEAHFNLGSLEQEQGNYSTAKGHYESALAIRPDYPEALLNLGLAQFHLGYPSESLANYQSVLKLRPDYPEAWLNLGDLQRSEGRLNEAETCFRNAIKLLPSNVPAHLNLSMVLDALGKTNEAEQEARSALTLAPENVRAQSYLGALLIKLSHIDEAIELSKRALGSDPKFAPAYVTLSQGLLIRNKLEEAARSCETLLEFAPENISGLTCLGVSRTRQRRSWEALVSLEKAVHLNPEDSDAMINLAICELLLGRYLSGWKHYEARWTTQLTFCVPRNFTQPRWRGEELLGRTLLLYGEQGFGDTIQFARYVPLAAKLGGRVLLECQPALKPLLQTMPGVDGVFGYGENLPAFDLQAPLLSLPGIFQTTLESIPAVVPYLRPTKDTIEPLPKREGARIKIAFAWCGSRSQNDDQRPLPMECLRPILEVPNASFYSFQTGPAAEELRRSNFGSEVVDLSPQLKTFASSAALLDQVDLVISIDTALAHLAGAMGKPAWVLLPFAPDWRWKLVGESCPWYPTLRLFRQSKFADWSEPVNGVVEELQALIRKRSAPAS